MEFVVPLHPEDLETTSTRAFFVKNVIDANVIDAKLLDEAGDQLLSGDVTRAALDNSVFDALYSFTKAWVTLSFDTKARLFEVLSSAVQEMLAAIRELSSTCDSSPPAMAQRRNGFKALTYLFSLLIQVAEKNTKDVVVEIGAPKKGNKARKGSKPRQGSAAGRSADVDDEDGIVEEDTRDGNADGDGAFDWRQYRVSAMCLLSDISSVDLRRMWSLGLPEEDFVGIFVATGFRLLASPTGMKDKELRRTVSVLVAGVVARFPAAIANSAARLVAAVTLHEHVAPIAADIVADWCSQCPVAAAEVLRELGRLSGAGSSSDAATLRRTAAFVTDISERQPGLVLANVAVLLPFFECDAYTMRSAMASVLASIISRSFSPEQRVVLPEGTRAELLAMLHIRAYDVHSLTRTSALKAFVVLASNAAIPQRDLPAAAALAVDRLRDKGVMVRRAALQLLRLLVEHNPFGPHANADVYEALADSDAHWIKLHTTDVANSDADGIPPDMPVTSAVTMQLLQRTESLASALLATEFSRIVQGAVPVMQQMLSSKAGSDVMNSIRFLARARAFDIPGAGRGLAQMLTLVWSPEAGIKEEVVVTFHRLYILGEALDDDEEALFGDLDDEDAVAALESEVASGTAATVAVSNPQRTVRGAKIAVANDSDDEGTNNDDERNLLSRTTKPKTAKISKKVLQSSKSAVAARKLDAVAASRLDPCVVADNLIGVITGATLAVRTSAEEVLAEISARKWVTPPVRQCLWDAVAAGCAALQQGQVHVAVCVASAMQEARSGGDNAVAAARAALTIAASARPSLHAALARARSALAVLAMILNGEEEDSASILANGLRYVSAVLEPSRLPAGSPDGCTLMILAANAAGIAPTDALIKSLDLGSGACGDYRLAAHACDILSKLTMSAFANTKKMPLVPLAGSHSIGIAKGRGKKAATLTAVETAAANCDGNDKSPQALAELIARNVSGIIGMLRGDWDGGNVESVHWYAAAQHGLDTIFSVALQPVIVCEALIRSMAEMCIMPVLPATPPLQNIAVDAEGRSSLCFSRVNFARLFFVAGHIAMKTLLHLDVAMKTKISTTEAISTSHTAAKNDSGGIEDQLGSGLAEADAEVELAERIAESEILAPARSICGLIAPIVAVVVTNMLHEPVINSAIDSIAQSALLSLCKMMTISNEFAVIHLPLVFTVLGSACPASMRSCIVVALGDLAFRFPNSVEPYTHLLYARLRDSDVGVRTTTLRVLSYLVLNDMIKIKGHVAEIAVCLNDAEPLVVALAEWFFVELSKRGSQLSNLLPDILSHLSRDVQTTSDTAVLLDCVPITRFDLTAFRGVTKFLIGLLDKEKHNESLAEKLLQRLGKGAASTHTASSKEERSLWRDVSYCLGQIPLNEKVVRKLAEGVRIYHRCLGQDDVFEAISGIAVKARRAAASTVVGGSKLEFRQIVDEWEIALAEARTQQIEEDKLVSKATDAAVRATALAAADGIDTAALLLESIAEASAARSVSAHAETLGKKAGRKAAKARQGVVKDSTVLRSTRAEKTDASEDDITHDDEGSSQAMAQAAGAPTRNKVLAQKSIAARRRLKNVVSSDEDDMENTKMNRR